MPYDYEHEEGRILRGIVYVLLAIAGIIIVATVISQLIIWIFY